MTFELEKIVNRYKELDNRKFVKIPQNVIELEKIIKELRDELNETKLHDKDNTQKIQLLESRMIQRMRDLNVAKTLIKKI